MSRFRIAVPITLALLSALFIPSSLRAEGTPRTEPSIWKSSIRVSARRFERYFSSPTVKEPQYLTTSWAPRFSFTIQGPLAGGSQLSVTFKKPDGSVWKTLPCTTPEIGPEETRKIDGPENPSADERWAILTTGTFSFTINLKNELAGKNETLYSGKLKVGKFHFGSTLPKFKNEFEYFVDHDWTLPIGHLYFDDDPSVEAPNLHVQMWFRGILTTEKIAGYLFYKGNQVASTKTGGGVSETSTIYTGGMLPEAAWQRWQFHFARVASTNKMLSTATHYPDTHFLDKNPGEYQVKVLRDGKLARTMTFTIGSDGKIVDNGLAAKNKMGGPWMLFPVKVTPGTDEKAVITNYRTDAFYSNPITGFPEP